MLKKIKLFKEKRPSGLDERKKDRRKPGDRRFPGRLVGKKAGTPRQAGRRAGDRRKD